MSDKPFYIGRPNIGDRAAFNKRLDKIFADHWLTNDGQFVREFESKLADYLGVKHCIAMSNGTIALELAIKALPMNNKQGQAEVIIPSMTFVATAHALKWQEVTPVFADIDANSYNLCEKSVESLINEHTTGIIGVHLYGRPCNIDTLENLADRYQLKLAFDAAHAFGAAYDGQLIAGFGDCEVFSFHATKVFNTFEGGAVTTNDDELAEKLRLMRNFGFAGEDQVVYLGTNGKMAEVNAAMGLTNLEALPSFIEQNFQNYCTYKKTLSGIPGIKLIEHKQHEACNYHYIIVEVDAALYGAERDALKDFLSEYDVLARRYFYPGCHRMEPYKTLYPNAHRHLENTERFSERMLALPNGMQINQEQVAWLCSLIESFPHSTSAFKQ